MLGWLRRRTADPQRAAAEFEEGMRALARSDVDEGARRLERAIAADPGHAAAHANLGALRKDQGNTPEAERLLVRALALQPALHQAAWNLAMLRMDAQQWSEAAQLLRDFTQSQPRDAQAHYWLGNALAGSGDMEAARAAYAAALKIEPRHARARWGLAMAQLPAVPGSAGQQQAALAAFAKELASLDRWGRTEARGDALDAVGAQQPFFLAYIEGNHRDLLARHGALCTELMARAARRAKLPVPMVPMVPAVSAPPRAGEGARLKVGIVSAHVHSHSVWHAIVRGWIEHLDPKRFEIQVFHTGSIQDSQTDWARSHAARLVQGAGGWQEWAGLIADARLDLIVYPEIGMDATTLRLAALRLARIQAASWGHPITTGLPTIDAYLSAQAFEPPDAQQHYTERLVALPRIGCAYRPYRTSAQLPPASQLADWGITPEDRLLIAPGVAAKYGPREDALWAEIARRCVPCKLVFFRGGASHWPRLEARLRTTFAAAGVDFDAGVRVVPWQSQAAWFGLLQRADVFLDTVGFSGFNTAMQAIECGTPIVAWEGAAMRGRFASGILRMLGLHDQVADTHAGYADRVEALVRDASARAQVRRRIEAGRASLWDDAAGVADFGQALIELARAT